MELDPLHLRVLVDPGDAELRAVWADALLERGDPWGEVIAMQLHAAKTPLTPVQDKRLRALIAKHRAKWLGPIGGIVQLRDGLVFDRGVLDACQIQVRHTRSLDEAIGSPLWGALRKIHFCDRFAWDPRIVPLLAHDVFRQLREVTCIGMNHVFVALARNATPLPFTSIWTIDDSRRGQQPATDIYQLEHLPGLPNLTRLGFTFQHEAIWLIGMSIIGKIATLGVTSYARAGTWVQRSRTRDNLRELELRRWWIPEQGPARPHWILRFTRGSNGDWSRLAIEAAGAPTPDILEDDVNSLRPVIDFEVIHGPEDVIPMFAGFGGERVVTGEPEPAAPLADSPRKARKKARVSRSRRR